MLSTMDRIKSVPDTVIIAPHHKSWVATRFTLIEESGISKRRCKHAECTKEYSRGTSHMILKRHWSKQHGTNDMELVNSSFRSSNSNNPHMSHDDNNYKQPTKKRPLKVNNVGGLQIGAVRSKAGLQNTNSSNLDRKLNNANKPQLDVKQVAKRLKESTSIHLTFDIHNVKKGGKSYGIITAHSLSETLDTKSVLLEYKHLPYPDDSNTIFEFLRSCITRFNIREKIVSIASNCSEPIVLAIQEMDKRYRLSRNFNFSTIYIKCFPQFIHVNVMDVLRTQEILLESIRKVAGYINSNNVILRPMLPDNSSDTIIGRTGSINESSGIISMDQGTRATGLRLPIDIRGNWNTTYNMIDTFLLQRGLIEPTLPYFQHPQDLTNINIDWDKLFTLKTLLKPFYSTIDYFVSHNCVPISLVAAILPRLINHLSSSWAYDDLVIAALNFKSQLESYHQMFHNDLTIITSLLDPRIKATFMPDEGQSSVVDLLRKRVESMPMAREKQEDSWKNSTFASVYRPFNNDEVTDYLSEGRVSEFVNIADYWSYQRKVYPALSTLARTLCCMQATSVSSDRMFSAGEHLDREKKQNDSTNSKVLMKSWAKYLER